MKGLPPSIYPALALLLGALGVYLRLAHPGLALPWYDEFRTLLHASGHSYQDLSLLLQEQQSVTAGEIQSRFLIPGSEQGPFEALALSLSLDPHNSILYYGLVHLVLEQGTPPLLAARVLSAALSTLLLPACFWLAWELWQEARSAWISLALVAVAPVEVCWAFEARAYGLWAVCLACACAALLRATRKNRWGWWFAYAGISAVAVHVHLLTLAVLVGHVAYVLLRERSMWPRLAAALVCVLVLITPWSLHVASLWQESVAPQVAWTGGPRHPSYWHHFSYALGHGLWGSFQGLRAEKSSLALLGLSITGATVLWFARDHWRQRGLLLVLLFAAVLVPMALMDLLFGGIRLAVVRYLVPSSLAAILMLARVLTTQPPQAAKSVALLALLSTATFYGWRMAHDPLPEAKWRSEPTTIAGIKQALESAQKPLVLSLGQVALPATLSTTLDPSVPFLFLNSDRDTSSSVLAASLANYDVFVLESRNLPWYYEPYAVSERQLLARLGADVSLLPVSRGLLRAKVHGEAHALRAR